MKNYLKSLKEKLLKNREENVQNLEVSPAIVAKDKEELAVISEKLGIKIVNHQLRKLPSANGRDGYNAFLVDKSNLIYFYPPNEILPTCPFDYYKGGKRVLSNRETYSEITNLDEILLEMVRVFTKALEQGIVIDPYGFMLKLNSEVKEKYHGSASLVINASAIMRPDVNVEDYNKTFRRYINIFLDHFIGLNFGVSVNRSETLKNELEALNKKVIDAGIRESAGGCFEMIGSEDEVFHGLQHYKLPTGPVLTKKNN